VTRAEKCKTRDHQDRAVRGSADVVCTKCNDRFPCTHACGHWDCIVVTGRELPEWAGPETRDAVLAELEVLYADVE
jgi:hypothetical protein